MGGVSVARLTWDDVGSRYYETGVDRGVLYVPGFSGVAWNGLISITENPTGGTAKPFYIDGVKHLNTSYSEEFEATIEAFTYPELFEECEGYSTPFPGFFVTAQPRKPFSLVYRTKIGNDIDGVDRGYKLHLIYNALPEPPQRTNATMGDKVDPTHFSWKITTRAPAISGYKRTAHFVIDSTDVDPISLAALEDVLYGSVLAEASIPDPVGVFAIFAANSSFVVIDHGDGSWTATGTSLEVVDHGDGTFDIDAPGATIISSDTYTLSSP
jgi:hypothetical protein